MMENAIRVLYVDDEPILLEVAKLYIERDRTFAVDTLTSAKKALERLNTVQYDAIVSDYQMPEMDGIVFLKQLKAAGNTTPFIIFTGRGREEVAIEALNSGADFYIQKGGEPKAQFAELSNKVRYAVMRERTEKALRASEEKYRTLFDNMQEGLAYCRMLYDEEGRPEDFIFLNVNAEFNRIIGIPAVTNKRVTEVIPGVRQAFPEVFEIYDRVIRTGKPEVFDFNFTSIGKWLHISVYSPAKEQFVTVFTDITEQKLSDDATRESEERYRNVVEDQTEFISRFLPDGTHVFVNEAYCRYFGLKREEILGHRFRPKILPEDKERVRQFFESLTPDHPVDTIDHRIIMPDGTIRWQRWSDRAIYDPSGTITEYQSVGRDITDWKREEQALYENEQRLTSIYNTVGAVIFHLTVEPHEQYRFTSVNAAFSRITGLPPEQVIGRKVNEVIPEPSLSMVLKKYRQAIEEKAIVRWEETSNYPSGEVTGEVSIAPIFDTAGNCTYLIGSVHDITDRKKAEEALHETNEYLHNLVDYANAPIIVWDPEFRITRFNHAFEDLTGMTEQEVIGQHLSILFPASSRETSLEQIKKTLAGERWDVVEIPILNLSGEIRIVLWNSANIVDASGTIISTIAQGQDITERKQAETNLQRKNEELNAANEQLAAIEEELRTSFDELVKSRNLLEENKATLDSIINESPIPQYVIDRNHRITHWNKALAEYSGITAESVIGTTEQWRAFYDTARPCLADLLLDGKVDKISAWYEGKFKKSILIDDAYEATDFFPRMTGEGKWLYFTAGLVRDRDGKVIGAIETLEDITHEKQAQEASALANKKLHLLSSITRHDILNQLTALKGYLELSRRAVHDPAKLSDFIKKEIKAAETIEEQISFTRDYQNMGVNAPIWQNVNASISRAVAALPMRDVRLELDCTGYEVLADQLLEKVFYNLIDNAIRHGGEKLSTIRFLCHESDRGMIIVCEDDGVGISRNEKEHLFERGFGKHTGLGLNLAREILSITGITIAETGEDGKGVRFEILVPKGKYRIANVQ